MATLATPRRPASPAHPYTSTRAPVYQRTPSNTSVTRPRVYHHASNSSVSSREGTAGDCSQTDGTQDAVSDDDFDFDAAQDELRRNHYGEPYAGLAASSSSTFPATTAPLQMKRSYSSNSSVPTTRSTRPAEIPRSGSPFPGWVPNGTDSATPPEAVPALPSSARGTPPLATPADDSLLQYVLSLRKRPGGSAAPTSSALARTQSETLSSIQRQDSHSRNVSTGSANSVDDEIHRADLARSTSGNGVATSSRSKTAKEATGLETVDLSHKKAAEVPLSVINALRGHIERLALGFNHLSELPKEFAQLGSSLRYLNVRVNYLTIFPAVLCEMPSLEILDISRNKLRKLPSNCGTLKNLKVLSISKNRIKRLPNYFAQMTSLRVLKLDHNPLEYPPREIVAFPGAGSPTVAQPEGDPGQKTNEAEVMQTWLANLQTWMSEHQAERKPPPRPLAMEPEQMSEDERPQPTRPLNASRRGGQPATSPIMPSPPVSADTPKAARVRAAPPPTSSSPSSISATASTTSRSTTSPTTPLSYLEAENAATSAKSPPPSHGRNASTSTAAPLIMRRPGLQSKKSLPDLRQSHAQILDDRIAAREVEPETPKLALNIAALRRPRADSMASPSVAAFPLPSPRPPVSGGMSYFERPHRVDTEPLPLSPQSARFAEAERPRRTTAPDTQQVARPSRPGPSLAKSPAAEERSVRVDRNSGAYFRRLSMLPPSTISKAVPPACLKFADAVRGILFAFSQILTALKQHLMFATADRPVGVVTTMVANAEGCMDGLVNALDRFDSSTRRATPAIGAVREIVATCKENVSIFSRLANVIALQLKALTVDADVRFSRQLLLSLHGSIGELGLAWASFTPVAAEVLALVKEEPATQGQPSAVMLQPPTPSPTHNDALPLPPTGPARLPNGLPGVPPLPSGAAARSRGASATVGRRHAGSFSVEDVRVGAALPQHSPTSSISMGSVVPNAPPPSTLPPVSTSMRPRPGAPKLTMPLASSPMHPPASTLSLASPAGAMPAYRDIFQHLNDLPPTPIGPTPPRTSEPETPSSMSSYNYGSSSLASSTSSLNTPVTSTPLTAKRPSPTPIATLLHNGPPSSTMSTMGMLSNEGGIVDDFLDMADTTTNVAFSVCALLSERPPGGSKKSVDLVELCEVAREATRRLKGELTRLPGAAAVQSELGDEASLQYKWRNVANAMTSQDAKRLWDSSSLFAKSVIQMASLAKSIHVESPLAEPAREGISQLAKATNTLLTIASVAVGPSRGK